MMQKYLDYVVDVSLAHDRIGVVWNVDYRRTETHCQVVCVHHILIRVHCQARIYVRQQLNLNLFIARTLFK